MSGAWTELVRVGFFFGIGLGLAAIVFSVVHWLLGQGRGKLVPALLLLVLPLAGCGEEVGVTAPTSVSPTPTPSPTPDPRLCELSFCEIRGESVVQGLGSLQTHHLVLTPFNVFRSPLAPSCAHPRRPRWTLLGPVEPVSDLNSFNLEYYAVDEGSALFLGALADVTCSFRVAIRR